MSTHVSTQTNNPVNGSIPPIAKPVAKRFRRNRKQLAAFGFLSPLLILMMVLMATPILMVIGYSIYNNVITNPNPEVVGLANYGEILSNPKFWNAGKNTLFFTLTSVVVHMILGLTFAMLLNTEIISTKVRAVFRMILILPWLFTVAIVAILWRLMLNPNGVINYVLETMGLISGQVEWLGNPAYALFALTFINIWAGYPFFMISLLAGLQGIPADLYEAAKVDGANPVQRFIHVTIPQLKPLMISLCLLDFIWTTQQFALIWMTTGGGPIDTTEVLSTFTYKLAFSRYEFSLASTSAVLILIASMIVAIFYARSQKSRD